MAVDDPRIVDSVSVSRDTGHVVLTISDHLPWDDGDHVQILEEKLNAYLRFIESGELAEGYPHAHQRTPEISLVLKHEPSAAASTFLQQAAE